MRAPLYRFTNLFRQGSGTARPGGSEASMCPLNASIITPDSTIFEPTVIFPTITVGCTAIFIRFTILLWCHDYTYSCYLNTFLLVGSYRRLMVSSTTVMLPMKALRLPCNPFHCRASFGAEWVRVKSSLSKTCWWRLNHHGIGN